MSRIGKNPIPLPKGVDFKLDGNEAHVKGPKGALSFKVPSRVSVATESGALVVSRHGEDSQAKAYHGLVQRLLRNMVIGVTDGFSKELEIQGVGYRANAEGSMLKLQLGFSHPMEYTSPKGITIETPKPTTIIVKGFDKQQVGQVAAEIRSIRPPEPYKGKGIRYLNERVRRKQGKTGQK